MRRIVECVPNFSEGRDISRVDAIVAAMCDVPGVFLLDRHSDPDHNRSVVTIAGEPAAVAESALRGIGKAVELIDLTRHTGAHPRVGSTDVVPFVPVENVTLDECVALAQNLGRQIWERFRIPVYFYEAAAERPERVNLENIRTGQFEALREAVLLDPKRAPDIGDPRLHPSAGAVVVGARKPLVAYNINLNTADLEIARRIAKKIRFSGGGLRYLKAIAVDLRTRNLVQVSTNLTDFEQTPVHLVFETVKAEAGRFGVTVAGSEIVGLIPRRAIEMAAEFYLRVENFSPAQVLENRIESGMGSEVSQMEPSKKPNPNPQEACGPEPRLSPSDLPSQTTNIAALALPFLRAIASPTAVPAGGSVTALAGAFAAALGEMVAGISGKKKSLAGGTERLCQAAAEFHAASTALAEAADRDAASYAAVIAAQKLPQQTADAQVRREAAIQQALAGAIEAPLAVARRAADVFDRLGQLESLCGSSMLADVSVGRLMAASAVRGALENVKINLASVTDSDFTARVRSESAALASRLTQNPVVASR